jgi:DNA-binding transcriptional LysR family regulator
MELAETALVYAERGAGEAPAYDLGMSTSTVYMRVKRFEHLCGGRLFSPNPGGAAGVPRIPSLTPKGEVAMVAAKELVPKYREAEAALARAKADLRSVEREFRASLEKDVSE